MIIRQTLLHFPLLQKYQDYDYGIPKYLILT